MKRIKLDFLNTSLLAFALVLSSSCFGGSSSHEILKERLEQPSGVYCERLAESIVEIFWRDDSDGESGYSVWLDSADGSGERMVGQVGENETSFVIGSGLVSGQSYNIGVRADAEDDAYNSLIKYIHVKMIPFEQVPAGSIIDRKELSPCLGVTYSFRNYSSVTNVETGLCWKDKGKATVDDSSLAGPSLPSTGKVLQVIPNVNLEYGVTYNVRAYLKSDAGVVYVDAGEMTLAEDLEPVILDWKEKVFPGLPDAVSVYETEDKAFGRNFHAWYAVADLKDGGIDFRTNVPSSTMTVDEQAASFYGDCYVLVNGGYFASGLHTGLAIDDFRVTGGVNNQRGSIIPSEPENSEIYPTTRGVFGTDNNGNPSVFWANGSGLSVSWFDSPVPSVKGEAKYPSEPQTWKSASLCGWLPRAAISAAPVLLKDGKCPFDFTTTGRGSNYYYTNYEFVADDIFGSSAICDRTAVGATEDGRVILFICDGRIPSSPGLNLLELARLMKGLGCVDALNLDGGGSTGMTVGDTHIGDTTAESNRKVMSTAGFFRRK